MKNIMPVAIAICVLLFSVGTIFAGDVYVQGHSRRNGTYVQPHYRSAPDGNFSNNWSTKGNINPYTSQPGTKRSPDNQSLDSLSFKNSNPSLNKPLYDKKNYDAPYNLNPYKSYK